MTKPQRCVLLLVICVVWGPFNMLILRRLEDHSALAAILVETGAWTEALALAKQHPSLNRDVYLPYARWLAEQEQFIEAQQGLSFSFL